MSLKTLERYDQRVAGEILAAAALLTSPMPGEEPDDLVSEYESAADDLLKEIRETLQIAPSDRSSSAQRSIDDFLSKAINRTLLSPASENEALKRAGDAGRLSPSIYHVEQPREFTEKFYAIGLKKALVQEVINSPDDFQHLMNDDALEHDKDNLSLFVKLIHARNKHKPHWVIVQTLRRGITQLAHAGWRVFPEDVDLSKASDPLGLLQEFVNTFGVMLRVGDEVSKFVDSKNVPKDAKVRMGFWGKKDHEYFCSISKRSVTALPKTAKIGIAYRIDIDRYKAALRSHGFNV